MADEIVPETERLLAAMIREAKRIEEDTLYSAKSHFEAGGRWSRVHFWIGLPAAVLSAIAGASAFGGHPFVAGAIAMVVTGLTAVMTFLNPDEKANRHQLAGARYNSVRNDARAFGETAVLYTRTRELVEQLNTLRQRRDGLNLESPQIARWAFESARRTIESGEAEYAVDNVRPG